MPVPWINDYVVEPTVKFLGEWGVWGVEKSLEGSAYIGITSRTIKLFCNSLTKILANNSEMVLLFPRLDFKGDFRAYNVFILRTEKTPVVMNFSSTSPSKSIIDYATRKRQYADYNVTSRGMRITLNNAFISNVWDETFVRLIEKIPYINVVFRFSKSLVMEQLINLFETGCYFSLFSVPTGFHELVVAEGSMQNAVGYKNAVQVNFSFTVKKTFSLEGYEGW